MQLKRLSIRRRENYEQGAGTLTGTIAFASPDGEFSINIEDDHCYRILEVVADLAVAHTQKIASLMKADIVETSRLLPKPVEPSETPTLDPDFPF